MKPGLRAVEPDNTASITVMVGDGQGGEWWIGGTGLAVNPLDPGLELLPPVINSVARVTVRTRRGEFFYQPAPREALLLNEARAYRMGVLVGAVGGLIGALLLMVIAQAWLGP